MKLAAVVSLGLLAGSCQDATSPSPIPPRPDVLTIAPAIEGLKLGFTETLTAVLVSGDGTRRTVPASWSSDAPDIATVDNDGRVQGVSLGKATIRATIEALSALQSVHVVPDYEGTWSGRYRVTGCTRLSGAGPDICRFNVGGGAILPFRTVVTQAASSVTGTLEFYSDVRTLIEAGPVEGRIDDSGALVLTGTTRAVHPEHTSETTLSDWNTTLTGDSDQMAGGFTNNRSFQNFWGPQRIREECVILMLQRSRP